MSRCVLAHAGARAVGCGDSGGALVSASARVIFASATATSAAAEKTDVSEAKALDPASAVDAVCAARDLEPNERAVRRNYARGDFSSGGHSRMVAVCRHAERLDACFETPSGEAWHATEDGKRFPHDPPLSDRGARDASRMGSCIRAFADERGGRFHFVVTSPYFRCVQTAIAIAAALGPRTRILVDESLGEVYGPEIMGAREPSAPMTRGMAALRELCAANGLECEERVHGERPVWPESRRVARGRLADAFVECLRRGSGADDCRGNYVLVTHRDGVEAALGLMPSEAGSCVAHVEHGGMFLAGREVHAGAQRDALADLQASPSWKVDVQGIKRGSARDSPEAVMRRRLGQVTERRPGLAPRVLAQVLSLGDLPLMALKSEAALAAVIPAALDTQRVILKSPNLAKLAARRAKTPP